MTTEATRKAGEALRDSFLTWAAIIDDLLSGEAARSHGGVPADSQAPHGGVVAQTEEAAVHVIEALGPMSTKALLPIIEREVPVGGKNKLSTLSARLSSAKRLQRTSLGWSVKH